MEGEERGYKQGETTTDGRRKRGREMVRKGGRREGKD